MFKKNVTFAIRPECSQCPLKTKRHRIFKQLKVVTTADRQVHLHIAVKLELGDMPKTIIREAV